MSFPLRRSFYSHEIKIRGWIMILTPLSTIFQLYRRWQQSNYFFCRFEKSVNFLQILPNLIIEDCSISMVQLLSRQLCIWFLSQKQVTPLSESLFKHISTEKNLLLFLPCVKKKIDLYWFGLRCVPPLSTIFQLCRGSQFYLWRKLADPKKTTDLSQVTDKYYHIVLYTAP